ncbi:MAG: NAD+ synthase [Chloroflexi bacterium]|nr:NAD+ synthase [Chloroflexota bacterium]
MTDRLRIAGAQIDLTVGDLAGNERKILEAMAWAEDQGADVLLLPELAITGYPPEDLVLREGFVTENLAVLDRLAAASGRVAAVVGFVDRLAAGVIDDDVVKRDVANAAAVLAQGAIRGIYHKELLPNYGVFDEARYFAESRDPVRLWMMSGVTTGVSICEDIWSPDGPPSVQAASGAAVLLNINGSPYHIGKGEERAALLRDEAVRSGAVVAYLNTVGGQDELVFDGGSIVLDPSGELAARAVMFDEDLLVHDIEVPEVAPAAGHTFVSGSTAADRPPVEPRVESPPPYEAEVYQALVTGTRDYLGKTGFSKVLVALSGGIDSSLVAVVAVDALGAENVIGIGMPSRYSSEGSIKDAQDLADNLGVRFLVVPIEPAHAAYLSMLERPFADLNGGAEGTAEENIQSRIRGNLIMALSNKFGWIVLTTGNKSEFATGYATLYGDMSGGYAVIKDVPKTLVYRLARYRNSVGQRPVIPESVITKPPSAELKPGQLDQDSLPPYEVLDAIIEEYVEKDRGVAEIVAMGHDEATVKRVVRMIDVTEYKRRQSPPGVKITPKAFGRDRRLPIAHRYRGL